MFANASAVDTTATFSTTGTYTLQLTADDSEHAPFDRTVVTVLPTGTYLLNLQVAASSDDAEEDAFGAVARASSDLEMVLDDTNQTVGLRFNALTIPQGSTIESAYLQFSADETNSEPTALSIRAELTDDANTFTSALFNLSSRPVTGNAVAWNPAPWTTEGASGPEHRSPNLATLVQEVVHRPGWSSGNSLVFLITGTGKRVARAFDGSPGAAPILSVVYNPTPPPCPADLVIENQTLSGSQTLQATASATLGPNLTVDGDNIAVKAPTVSIRSGTSISGNFTISNNPSCP